jgi:hypothetical protein
MSDGCTNELLQANPWGYLCWQEEQRGKAELKRKQAEERDDSEQFARMLIERGRDPSNSREMYERYRNHMALEESSRMKEVTASNGC